MTQPSFLVIGAMKAGTTSLYTYLRDHPEVYMSQQKELQFFTRNWDRGWEWYESQFAESGNAPAVGEASPSYTKCGEYPETVDRIWQHLPDARLVYIVRHPIDRMRSHYHQWFERGLERAPIERALLDNPVYLDTSRYGRQLEQYLTRFSRAQILLVTSDDLMHSRADAVRRVYEFIGVDPTFVSSNLERTAHRTDSKREPGAAYLAAKAFRPAGAVGRLAPVAVKKYLFRQLSPKKIDPEQTRIPADLRRRLEAELAEDVARLKMHMGDGFDGWGIA